jgi:hypothetical protein
MTGSDPMRTLILIEKLTQAREAIESAQARPAWHGTGGEIHDDLRLALGYLTSAQADVMEAAPLLMADIAIDHIDGDPHNHELANLRLMEIRENTRSKL